MRRMFGGGKLFIAGAAVLMAGLVIGTLLAMNALLGHALSPSYSANAADAVPTAQPAAAQNLQVIAPAAIAPSPATPILVYSPPTASQPIVVSDGTTAEPSDLTAGGTGVKSAHPTIPATVAAKAPGAASGT
ncbi:MAG TPA: hypothetical protein VKY26_12430, partial [Actinomycetota bacterium]|nr:hypothetical protein [Actinomycetota bacterium]